MIENGVCEMVSLMDSSSHSDSASCGSHGLAGGSSGWGTAETHRLAYISMMVADALAQHPHQAIGNHLADSFMVIVSHELHLATYTDMVFRLLNKLCSSGVGNPLVSL